MTRFRRSSSAVPVAKSGYAVRTILIAEGSFDRPSESFAGAVLLGIEEARLPSSTLGPKWGSEDELRASPRENCLVAAH